MKQGKQWAQQHRSLALVFALGLAILVLSLFAAPATSSAQDAPDDTIPGGTVPPGTVPPIPLLQPSITFVHAASFDADPDLTAIDVCTDAGAVVPFLEDMIYREAQTLYFDPNSFDWKIATAGTNCTDILVNIPPFSLGYGAVKILVFAGDGVNQPLEVIDVLAREGDGALFMPFISVTNRLG